MKDIKRRTIAQYLVGTVVQPVFDLLNPQRRDLGKIDALGKVFTNQAVGVLVQAALLQPRRCIVLVSWNS